MSYPNIRPYIMRSFSIAKMNPYIAVVIVLVIIILGWMSLRCVYFNDESLQREKMAAMFVAVSTPRMHDSKGIPFPKVKIAAIDLLNSKIALMQSMKSVLNANASISTCAILSWIYNNLFTGAQMGRLYGVLMETSYDATTIKNIINSSQSAEIAIVNIVEKSNFTHRYPNGNPILIPCVNNVPIAGLLNASIHFLDIMISFHLLLLSTLNGTNVNPNVVSVMLDWVYSNKTYIVLNGNLVWPDIKLMSANDVAVIQQRITSQQNAIIALDNAVVAANK